MSEKTNTNSNGCAFIFGYFTFSLVFGSYLYSLVEIVWWKLVLLSLGWPLSVLFAAAEFIAKSCCAS